MIVGTAFHSNKKAAILRGKMDEGGSLDEQYPSVDVKTGKFLYYTNVLIRNTIQADVLLRWSNGFFQAELPISFLSIRNRLITTKSVNANRVPNVTFSAFEVETGRKLFLNGGDNLSVEAHKKIKAPMEINISEEPTTTNVVIQRRKRSKHICPERCGFQGEQLPRHMRTVHGWLPSKARKVVNTHGLRKKYTFTKNSMESNERDKGKAKKDYHKQWQCPLPKCFAVVLRPTVHLHTEHSLEKDSAKYRYFVNRFCAIKQKKRTKTVPKLKYKKMYDEWERTDLSSEISDVSEKPREIQEKRKRTKMHSKMKEIAQDEVLSCSSTDFEGRTEIANARTYGQWAQDELLSDTSDDSDYVPEFEKFHNERQYKESSNKALCTESDGSNSDYVPNFDKFYNKECDNGESGSQTFSSSGLSGNTDFKSTTKLTKNQRAQIIFKFEEWLDAPDSMNREEKTVKQNVHQLKTILDVLGEKGGYHFENLFNRDLIVKSFLGDYCKMRGYKPKTIKSYLGTIGHFYDFLLDFGNQGLSVPVEIIQRFKVKIKVLKESLKKPILERMWEKKEFDMDNLPSVSDMQTFENSKAARDAINILYNFADETKSITLDKDNYSLVRNYLLAEILIDNPHRSGVLAGLSCGDFSAAKMEDGMYEVKVKKHKTSYKHGPGRLWFDPRLKSWLELFINNVRTHVPGTYRNAIEIDDESKELPVLKDDASLNSEEADNKDVESVLLFSEDQSSDSKDQAIQVESGENGCKDQALENEEEKQRHLRKVFVTFYNRPMSSGEISNGVHTIFKKAGIKRRTRLSATVLRKNAISKAYDIDESKWSGPLADFMGHLKYTAKRDYECRGKQKSSLKAAKAIPFIVRGQDKDLETDINNPNIKLNKGLCDEEDIAAKESISGKGRFRHKWTAGELNEVKKMFKKEIASKVVSIEAVREKLKGACRLSQLSAGQVRDKIRSLFGQADESPANLPLSSETPEQRTANYVKNLNTHEPEIEQEEDQSQYHNAYSDSIISPSTKAVSKMFESNEKDAIRRLFADMISKKVSIRDRSITDRLKESNVGEKLKNKYTVRQLRNRIKYERRMHMGTA